jgi:hypothetical protein
MIQLQRGARTTQTSPGARKDLRAIRAHNERLVLFEPATEDHNPLPLVCECDDPACARAVLVPRSLAAAVHATRDQVLVVPGHAADLDVVLKRPPGCWVVIAGGRGVRPRRSPSSTTR